MYNKKIDLNEVKAFIDTCGPDTKIYLGCDSERLRVGGVWYADYIIAIVVHIDGKHGGKVFGQITRERDFDQNKSKPRMRLMTECYKVAELYLELQPIIDMDIEVHLDINSNMMYNSSIVVKEAIGYIQGMCNVIPMVKPQAWAASYVADRYKSYMRA